MDVGRCLEWLDMGQGLVILLVSQTCHVVADPRSVERELVVKGRILTSSPDLAPFSPCSSSGYLRELSVIVGKGVGNSLPVLVGMELGCTVGNS